jgi:hypothetical protein
LGDSFEAALHDGLGRQLAAFDQTNESDGRKAMRFGIGHGKIPGGRQRAAI